MFLRKFYNALSLKGQIYRTVHEMDNNANLRVEDEDSEEENVESVDGIPFRKYSKIINYESDLLMREIINAGYTDDTYEWVMTEKVHGANFSFSVTGETVLCAKRSGYLSDDARFYNFQHVKNELSASIQKAFSLIKLESPEVEQVVFYGELFGGLYPHPDVPRDSRFTHVQKGVYYSPAVHFYLFDIFVKGKSFMDLDNFLKIAQNSGFIYSKPLKRGKFAELIAFNVNSFVSTLPSQLGYPELPQSNIAEGVVLKLVHNKYVKSGRVMVKIKSEAFKEVTGVYNTKKNSEPKLKLKSESKVSLPKNLQDLYDNLLRYVTENRLRNVLSKIGPVTTGNKEFSKVVGSLAKDTLEDFSNDFPSWKELVKEDQKKCTAKLSTIVTNLVTKHWPSIISGEF